MKILEATNNDIETLFRLDHVAHEEQERRELIERAIQDQRAWVLLPGEAGIAGYGVITHEFFGRSFIELIYIDEQHRSKGYGPALIAHLEKHSRSDDIFTSTNESNTHMQHVLANLGYERSGTIFNLDPGDPELVYVKQSVRPHGDTL